MTNRAHPAGLPARILMLLRDTFAASVAIHYDAPWKHSEPDR
jgi:hypothetical protein